MDKRINSGSGCYDYNTVVAAAPTTKKHYTRLNIKPKQQEQPLINTAITARGNSSPKLAATFQGMSVNVLQNPSSGVHSWPISRQDEKSLQATTTIAAAAARSKQVPMMILHRQQQQQQHNTNNNNHNNAVKLLKPPAVMEQQQQQQAGIRTTKPRNKSEGRQPF